MKTSHEKALKRKSTSEAGKFFDSMDKKLGNGRYLTNKPHMTFKPRTK